MAKAYVEVFGYLHELDCLVARYAKVALQNDYPFPWCTCPNGSKRYDD